MHINNERGPPLFIMMGKEVKRSHYRYKLMVGFTQSIGQSTPKMAL
jgi:hypothetical protein